MPRKPLEILEELRKELSYEVITSNQKYIERFQDGNQVGVILGTLESTNIQESPCGFGDNLSEALRNLADELEK